MDEISLFGITISTFANLLVAFGTIVLAIVTCISVQTSQKQFAIFRQGREKPQALDQIQNVFNVIQEDLSRELDVIDRSAIIYALSNGPNINDVNPLVFPLAAKKHFFMNFRKSFSGESVLSDKRILRLIDLTEKDLQKRFGIYQSLSGNMTTLENEIVEQYIKPNFTELVAKVPGLDAKPLSAETGPTWKIFRGNQEMDPYFVSYMKRSIANIFLSKILKSRDNQANLVMSYISDFILEDLNRYIQTLMEQNPDEKFNKIKREIDHDLVILKNTDESINSHLQEIIMIYRDMFLFTATEIEPQNDNW